MRTTKDQGILERLAVLLASPMLPVQQVIAHELGCDQPFISRVANRQIVRITPRVVGLRRYAIMRVRTEAAAERARSVVDREIARGGDEADARVHGSHHIDALARGTRRGVGAPDFASDAISGVKMYLEDGYDARLIVEQLAVLRRAQRIRMPGRRSRAARDAATPSPS